MLRTYKYRLYPRLEQDKSLDFLLWQSRKLYNAALEQRIKTYKDTGECITYPDQWSFFRDNRHTHPDTLGKLNATSTQQLLRRLDKSFSAFFRRLKSGEKPGFPRFKGRHRFRSLEYRHGDGCKLRQDKQGRPVLYVQNVGEVKVKYHRPLPKAAVIKHVIVKRQLDKWYVCLMLEMPDVEPIAVKRPVVGIDMGLQNLLALSDGQTIDNPRWLRQALTGLRTRQRRMARRKKGSNRRRKAAFQVAKQHEKLRHQRLDFWHKLTRRMAEQYHAIALEKLTLSFMAKNQYLALSAHDAGLGLFQQLLSYKVEETGSQVIAVDPKYTTQACSGCGVLVEKSLRVRVHRCPECEIVLDRDINAARNILKLGLTALGRSVQASTGRVAAHVA